MIKNTDFLGSMATNPFNFRHYDLDSFVCTCKENRSPAKAYHSEWITRKRVMGYRTLFEGWGIHHSNAGLQITHDMYIAGYFMLLFDMTPDLSASEGHVTYG